MNRTFSKILINAGIILFFLLLTTNNTFAVTGGYGGSGGIDNPIAASNFFEFVASILSTIAKLAAVVTIVAIIYSGFLFVAAQGNEEKLQTAKKAITYTLIGAAIGLGAAVIAQVISNTINSVAK
jgi:hypothetical protein